MKLHKKIFLFSLLFSFYNLLSFVLPLSNTKNLSDQFDTYLSLTQKEQINMTAALTGIVGICHILHYMSDAYNDKSIKDEYPFAYAWYCDEITQKHPAVHLDTKKLLSSNYATTAGFYNIYFQHTSLQQINDIYAKKIKGIDLTDTEEVILKQQEFLILSQAGYIEKNCLLYNKSTNMFLFVGTNLIQVPLLGFFHKMHHLNSIFELQNLINTFSINHTIYAIVDATIYITMLMPMTNNHYENISYQFACQHADLACLQAGLKLFEHNKIHENITSMIKEEIEKRKIN
ncbi:MAG: hypothetical protein ACXWL2_00710 [Candidatus Chromulinivorax sp.]